MDSLNGTWEAGNAEPVAGNEALGRKTNTGITALYPGDSGATTDEVPVMGMEEQAPVSNNKKQHTRYSRVLVRNKKNHSRKEVVDLGTTETHQKAKGPKCRVL